MTSIVACAVSGLSAFLVAGPSMAAKKPAVLWAHVDEDRQLVRGIGVDSVRPSGPRTVIVFFDRNVQKCSIIASPATSDRMVAALPLFDDLSPDIKNGVIVHFADRQGSVAVDSAFFVQVTC